MMRGRRAWAVAVRAPDGGIVTRVEQLGSLYRSRWAQVPFVRGLVLLWDALVLGVQALTFSANVQAGEEEQLSGASLALTLAASLGAGIGLFFLLPAGAAWGFERLLGVGHLTASVVEGLARLGLLIGYLAAIGRIPEVGRVFGYHAAEHMTIHAFEAGAPLEVSSVCAFPREHPRCGTAFLLTVVILSILVFSLLGPLPLASRLASRLLLVPVLAALAYEYLRLTTRLHRYQWARPLVMANLALQRLTTRPPEPGMVEVAITAFEAMRSAETAPESEPAR